MIRKIVPDTSVMIESVVSKELAEIDEEVEIIIPETVVDEIESQANKNLETGKKGIEEIKRIQELSEKNGFKVKFPGSRPGVDEISLAKKGRLDAMIRDFAKEHEATLWTGDKVQAEVAEAKGIETRYFESETKVNNPLEEYFDEHTMSVHLKTGSKPEAKIGRPGEFSLKEIGDEELKSDEMQEIISEIVEAAEVSESGLLEMNKEGATVVQLDNYRISIARPPFSEKDEVTAVRPVAKVSFEDYNLSESVIERVEKKAEGILIAGAPGHGKSTFAQALAEKYQNEGEIVKTMEKPRDLDLGDEITQYADLEEHMENTGDFLLLTRPDYTVYDEVRQTSDFEVYSDLRMAGVGMIGVVHASDPVDAVQRLIGRVELGMIPQVTDTVFHVRNAEIAGVYSLELQVKVPEGMTEEDLARPVIEFKDFESGEVKYEIYTYGEETVVVPVESQSESNPVQMIAKNQIERDLQAVANDPEVEFVSDSRIKLQVQEDEIPHVIGRDGERIDELESQLGLNIDVEPKTNTTKKEINHEVSERGGSVVIEVGEERAGNQVDIFSGNEFMFTATVGKSGEVSVTKKSGQAGEILAADKAGKLKVMA